MEAVEKRFVDLESRMTKVEELEQRIKELEDRIASGSAPIGSGTFCPGYLELKVCDWDDRKTKGVERKQAERLVGQLRTLVPETLQPHIKEVILQNYMNHKIRVTITPRHAHELRGCMEEAIGTHKITINDGTPRVFLERSPAIRSMYERFGKLADLCRTATAGKPIQLEVKPQSTSCYVVVPGRDQPVLVGEVSKDTDAITLNEECLRDHLGMTREQFMSLPRRR